MNMLRLTAFLLVTVGITVGATLPAHAQDGGTLPRGNVSGFGVYAASASDGLDSGHGFGVSGAYFFSRIVGVEGGFRRQSFDVLPTDANAVSGGELSANVITVNVIARFAAGGVQPYVSGGVALVSSDYSIDPGAAAELAQFNFSPNESFDDTIGFNIAGGVDFQASSSVGFFVEGRFLAATADTVGGLIDDISQVTATSAGEQELNVVTVSGGIRILF
jgi:hypothetical protein